MHIADLGFLEILKILLKWSWVILISAVAGFACGYVISEYFIPARYTSSISLHVNNSPDASGTINLADINAAQRLVNTYIVILEDDEVLDELGDRLLAEFGAEWLSNFIILNDSGGRMQVDTDDLRRIITMSSVNNTEVLRIEAQTGSPHLSARICTIMTEIAPAILMRVVRAGSVEIIGAARPADEPSSPRVFFNSAIGAFVGVIISSLVALMIQLHDDAVKDEDGLKKHFNLPVLGEIPDFNSAKRGGYSYYGGK